jgi:hypothetical protein
MEVLTFRPTARQIALLAAAVAVLVVAAAAILAPHYAVGAHLSGSVLSWGIGAAVGAPSLGWVLLRYKRAFTECSPSGIRSRGLGPEWRCDWAHVREIAIRRSSNPRGPDSYTVIVTTASGDRLQLGMPVRAGLMPDPNFEAKAERIRAYWQAAIGAQPAVSAAVPVVTGGSVPVRLRTFRRLGVELILVAAVITVPFTVRGSGPALLARLGYGQQGYFTATTFTCDSSCYWVGDFTPARGAPLRTGFAMAPGARIAHGGQRVAAAYLGNGRVAYPAGGGPNWIPLALLLLVIVACLVPTIGWLIGWSRRAIRSPVLDYGHDFAAARRSDRTISSTVGGVFLGLAMVVLAFGGAALGYAAHLVPASPPPATLACAEYLAWLEAQPNSGSPDLSPALLAAATRNATGQLQIDLATLSGDVTAENGSSGIAGLAAAAGVLKDTETVDAACRTVD